MAAKGSVPNTARFNRERCRFDPQNTSCMLYYYDSRVSTCRCFPWIVLVLRNVSWDCNKPSRDKKTPSLENLSVEFPPDFPKPHLFRKRLSLPSLQVAPPLSSRADFLARRRSLITVPEDFQKRINSFLSDLDLLKGGVSEECVAVATEEGAGQEQVGEERRGRQRKDWAAVPLEEALREVRYCRYLRHGERPDWERELRLEEIFCKEEGRSERAGEESPGLQRD
ncbi:UNVERIFIED_CONTAM: hypothetical protein FKN15_059176 [Acipenser sinensis]